MTTTTDPTLESHSSDEFGPSSAARVQARTQRPLPLTARMKALQSSKIREVAEAVKSAGFLTLDEQAKPFSVDHQSYAGRAGAATACPNQDPRIRRGKSCRLIWRQPESTP